MGCASSMQADARRRTQITVRRASYAAVETHPAIASAEQPLHAAAVFGSYVTPDDPHYEAVEEYEHFAARHGAYAASAGDAEEEPSAFARSVTISVRVAAARLCRGVNGDPGQFPASPEPTHTIDGSIKKTVRWLESCEAAAQAPEHTTTSAVVVPLNADDDPDQPFGIPPVLATEGLSGVKTCGDGLDEATPSSTVRIAASGRSVDTTAADSPTRRGVLPVVPCNSKGVTESALRVLSPSSAFRGLIGAPSASSTELAHDSSVRQAMSH